MATINERIAALNQFFKDSAKSVPYSSWRVVIDFIQRRGLLTTFLLTAHTLPTGDALSTIRYQRKVSML